MSRPVINIADLELQPRPPALAAPGPAAERFDARIAQIGPLVGARKLGYNITAVAPGRRAFPFHNHHANEEMFFVLTGQGEVRIGDKVYSIREGDIIACPAGGQDTAHQIINTGDVEMRYLAVSTCQSPELVEYPDSGKFGVLAEMPNGDGRFAFIGRTERSLDYWEGE